MNKDVGANCCKTDPSVKKKQTILKWHWVLQPWTADWTKPPAQAD